MYSRKHLFRVYVHCARAFLHACVCDVTVYHRRYFTCSRNVASCPVNVHSQLVVLVYVHRPGVCVHCFVVYVHYFVRYVSCRVVDCFVVYVHCLLVYFHCCDVVYVRCFLCTYTVLWRIHTTCGACTLFCGVRTPESTQRRKSTAVNSSGKTLSPYCL